MTNNLRPALIGVVVIIVLGILFGGRFGRDDDTTPEPSAASSTATGQSARNDVDPPEEGRWQASPTVEHHHEEEGVHGDEEPIETPDGSGHDDHGPVVDEYLSDTAIATTEAFIEGWLTPDHLARATQLAPVGGESLVEQLAVPKLRVWNTTPQGAPEVVELLETTCMTRQRFMDGRAVDLLLLAEPGAPHGWVVTDIQPVR